MYSTATHDDVDEHDNSTGETLRPGMTWDLQVMPPFVVSYIDGGEAEFGTFPATMHVDSVGQVKP
jgi:hypothetical protein